MRKRTTGDYINIFGSFDSSLLLLMNSNLMAGFEVSLDPSVFTDEDYLQMEKTLSPLFKTGRRYYFVFTRGKLPLLSFPSGGDYEVVKVLRTSVAKHLKKLSLFEERAYIFIEATVGEDMEKEFKKKLAFRSPAWVEEEFSKRVENFKVELTETLNLLRRCSTYGVRKLTSGEAAGIIYSLFSLQNFRKELSEVNLYQLLSSYDLVVEDGLLRVGNTFATVLALSTIPPNTFTDFFEDIRSLNGNYYVTQVVSPVTKNTAVALMGAVTNFVSGIAGYKFLGVVAERMKRIAGMNAAIMEAIDKGEQPVEFSPYVVIYGDDKKELKEEREYIISKFMEHKAQFVPENLRLLSSFLASIPGHAEHNLRKKLLISSSILDLINPYSETSGDEKPVVVFQTEKNSLLKIDPFSPSRLAWNFFVTGSTGSGKSFFMNYFLLNSLIYSPYVFIFDLGESYKTIVKFLDAKIFRVNLNSQDVRLNPFIIPKLDKSHLQYLMLFIETLITDTQGESGIERKVQITDAIRRAYEKVGINEGEEIPPDATFPTLSLVRDVSKGVYPSLWKKLALWVKGAEGELYGDFFDNEKDNFSFQKVQYIEMTGFDKSSELASALIFVLFNKLFDTIGEKPGKKIVLLDEVWKFLLNPLMAAKIEELFRTARKFGASIGIVTQHPNDILKSPHADAVLANTQVKYFLHQKEIDDEKKWRETFKFNSRAIEIMKGLRTVSGSYSEVLIWADEIKKKVRLKVNPLLYWLFTTKEEERRKRDSYIEKHGVRAGLVKLLEEVYGERNA